MKVAILTVGDELLIGQVIDSNSAWMGTELSNIGVEVVAKCAVADDASQITEALNYLFGLAPLILMTGGLGPTKDDITKKVLAEYFGSRMTFSEETYHRICYLFEQRNIPLTEAHRVQCYMPEMAELLPNKMGTAPGMWISKGSKAVISMPGVPYEMKYIMKHSVIPRFEALSNVVYRKKTIRTAGIGESRLAQLIEPSLSSHPVKVAYLPSVGQVRLRLSNQGTVVDEVERSIEDAAAAIEPIFDPYIYGYDDDTLEAAVGRMLQERHMTICTAESCTGGYLAHMITSVPGSSAYYVGSMVTYSNDMKTSLLGVPDETLAEHGAVSEATVRSMVTGAILKMNADIGVAISGISGPSGGTAEKPVGTVWIAVGNADQVIAEKFLFTKDRVVNIKYTAVYALIMVRKFLLGR